MSKLRFSENAWHIRLCRQFSDDYTPDNLCHHFWATAGALAFYAVMIAISIGVLVFLILAVIWIWGRPWLEILQAIINGIIGFFAWLWRYKLNIFITSILALIFALAAILVLRLLGMGVMWLWRLIPDRPEKPAKVRQGKVETLKKERKPSMVWEFLTASKHRYCRLIEVVGQQQKRLGPEDDE